MLTGCVTTRKEKYLTTNTPREQKLMDIETEIKFGNYVDAIIQNEYMVLNNYELQQKAENIFYEIVDACDRKDMDFKLTILNTNDKNAFAGPGGYVYITTGILDMMTCKDELAGVFAHEIGHICARHSIKSFYGKENAKVAIVLVSVGAACLGAATTQDPSIGSDIGRAMADISSLIAIITVQGYSRQDEYQADALAVKYTKKLGYDPLKMIDLLKKMRKEREEEAGEKTNYSLLDSHPSPEDREENIKEQIEYLSKGEENEESISSN